MTWDLEAHAKRGHWPAPSSPTNADPDLEAKAMAQGQTQLTPAVSAIKDSSGFLTMLRNRSNQAMVDPEDQTLK